ncbi:FimV/HubP family polar landmark protein, partial [Vibrio sp. TRT 21S02]|uniref:FimV/HubP family polar landmark protein n=1 Tax=Vibrio sp. TRT 21S02 TaxID=3418507 RepID=UPI003CF5F52E
DALADIADEPAAVESESAPEPIETEPAIELDDLELPEYSEEDALADIADEPAAVESESAPEPIETEQAIELDELELPEYSEEDALADIADEAAEVESESAPESIETESAIELDELELPEYSEEDALADIADEPAEAELAPEPVETEQVSQVESERLAPTSDVYNEQEFNELLAENSSSSTDFNFDAPMDSHTVDSAGMDIDAMLEVGGEDWNGFNLSPEQQAQITDDIPEDEQGVWDSNNTPEQAEVDEENWEEQENLAEFDPKENNYRTIDELMAEVDQEELKQNLDDEELNLDVGLNDFPDVIGDIDDFDVDANAEAAGKLDLAKIYIEMNDNEGAIKLLEEAIVDGKDEIRREAKNLIDTIRGR